jgi:lipopolysaccharide/colanic/teichoic acid biosynthesis glycosyltransferase
MSAKRATDLLGAALGLVLLSPLLAAIGLGIKMTSRGPIVFRQTRTGLGGRPFQMLKFRTMAAEADEHKEDLVDLNDSRDQRLFKIERDPRVTPLGRMLRKYSLDELPQLWNVLKGEMSLVGPRPFFPEDLDLYELRHLQRYSVLPGITGEWQVNGRSDVQDFEEVVDQDLEYIEKWSILRDLWILVKTIPAVIQARGAM